MDNIEPKNHSEWKLYTFQEVLSMKCIDDFEEYIRKTIQRLVQHKNFWIKEGAIAQGKSFLQKYRKAFLIGSYSAIGRYYN